MFPRKEFRKEYSFFSFTAGCSNLYMYVSAAVSFQSQNKRAESVTYGIWRRYPSTLTKKKHKEVASTTGNTEMCVYVPIMTMDYCCMTAAKSPQVVSRSSSLDGSAMESVGMVLLLFGAVTAGRRRCGFGWRPEGGMHMGDVLCWLSHVYGWGLPSLWAYGR